MNVMVSGDDGKGVQIWSPLDQCCNGAFYAQGNSNESLPNHGASSTITTWYGCCGDWTLLWTLVRPSSQPGPFRLRARMIAGGFYGPLMYDAPIGNWTNTSGIPIASPVVVDGYVFVASNAGLDILAPPNYQGPQSRRRAPLGTPRKRT